MDNPSPLFTQPYDFSILPIPPEDDWDWRKALESIASGSNYEFIVPSGALLDTRVNSRSMDRAWFHGKCKACGYPAVVILAQLDYLDADYHYFCSNKTCAHPHGEDMDGGAIPAWVVL
jgi:hypothetical protein